jgi:hypothetical protein
MRGPFAFVVVGFCWGLGHWLQRLRERWRKIAAALRLMDAWLRQRLRR